MGTVEQVLFGLVAVAVGAFNLIYGVRKGKIVMGHQWSIDRVNSPFLFWLQMGAAALLVLGGFFLLIVGV